MINMPFLVGIDLALITKIWSQRFNDAASIYLNIVNREVIPTSLLVTELSKPISENKAPQTKLPEKKNNLKSTASYKCVLVVVSGHSFRFLFQVPHSSALSHIH